MLGDSADRLGESIMRTRFFYCAVFGAGGVLFSNSIGAAEIGTAFTFQGHLKKTAGTPVDDACDFRFGLWDAVAGGNQQGSSPQTVMLVDVNAGVFSTLIDFGAGSIDGTARWLEIEAKCTGDADFVLLSPRVELTPAPHAVFAEQASSAVQTFTIETVSTMNCVCEISGDDCSPGQPACGPLEGDCVPTGLGPTQICWESEFGTQHCIDVNPCSENSSMNVVSGGGLRVRNPDPQCVCENGGRDCSSGQARCTAAEGECHPTDPLVVIGTCFDSEAGPPVCINIDPCENDPVVKVETSGGLRVARPSTAPPGPTRLLFGPTDDSIIAIDPSAPGMWFTDPYGWRFMGPGALGVGTTTPTEKLDVVGNIKASGTMQIGNTIFINPFNDTITASSGIISFDNENLVTTGNVGIGLATPTERLHVRGNRMLLESPGNPGKNLLLRTDGGELDLAASGARLFISAGLDLVLNPSAGDVGIRNPNPSQPLHVGTVGNTTNGNGAHVTPGGVWTNGSDRNSKRSFEYLDKQEVLEKVAELPVTRWQYKGEPEQVRHIGPVAQDFYAAFGTGADDRYIGTIDADGVALAAIQGLHQLVQEKDCEIADLRAREAGKDARIESLEARLAKIEAMLVNREASKNGESE